MARYKIGIDVGGTFTDFYLVSEDGASLMHKTLSTPLDPSEGFITGIHEIAEKLELKPEVFFSQIETIVHGTTVATNALLTLGGSRTALVTTKGFRDALEMRRGIREEQYNNHYRNVTPLVPRQFRFTVDERTDANGSISKDLDTKELDKIITQIKDNQIQSVAICFMNSYLNATNEKKAVEYLRQKLPGLFITASFEVLPSVRFYERVSTTVVNAYIGVVVAKYLASLVSKLSKFNYKGKLLIMQSNGGVVTPEEASKKPAVTALSGPAAAPVGGAYYAELLGFDNCITMDMGGTSFDASLVVNNQCVTSSEGAINRYRIALPTLDIITIGAGGGSIGWIDNGGLLQMGPKSAGALPGPVCYGRKGELPACTDADLVLGYLDPEYFAGGKIILDYENAKKAIETKLGTPLNMAAEKAASGMYKIINMNMAQGVRQVSIERGYDPREFLMIVAGGAGAIHAGEICRELEIPMFVVPDVASVFCAAGMLLGDLKHDYIKSYLTSLSALTKDQLNTLYAEMVEEGKTTLIGEGISIEKIFFQPILDLRYIGQYHEVSLETTMDIITSFDLESIKKAFHQEHNRLFGYSLAEEETEIEIINVRLRATGITDKPLALSKTEYPGDSSNQHADISFALKGNRIAFIPETDSFEEVPIYDGNLLTGKYTVSGPAIIEQINTSVFLGNSYACQTGVHGAYVVYSKSKFPEGISGKSHKELLRIDN